MLVYLLTRIYQVAQFPIYFFCDEAFFGVKVEQLLLQGFHDNYGHLFPLFFEKATSRWVPQITLYLYVIPVLLFGKSIEVIRITSALSTCLAPFALGLFLKRVSGSKLWWLGPYILAVIPTWILHSRTAFETVQVVVAFSLFMLAYGLYRSCNPRYAYAAAFTAMLTAYSHLSGLIIIICLSLLLFVSDFRYHLQHWRCSVGGLLFGALLALPYLQFRLTNPEAVGLQLQVVDSVWFQRELSLPQRAATIYQNFLHVADPRYWSGSVSQAEIARHVWKSRGHIEFWMWPFAALGFISIVWSLKSTTSRLILFATLATLSPTLVVSPGLMRVFSFIIPFSIVTILGLETICKLTNSIYVQSFTSIGVAGLLSIHSFSLLDEALRDAPTWSHDYGLYGMQWGAKQIFEDTIPEFMRKHPGAKISISPNWANAGNIFVQFFDNPLQRQNIETATIDPYLSKRKELTDDHYFLMTAEDYKLMLDSQILDVIDQHTTIIRPDGSPGFYLANLRYSAKAAQILEQKRLDRQKLVSLKYTTGSEDLVIRHSLQDMGELKAVFDSDPRSLLRGMEANPFIFEIDFPAPRNLQTIEVNLAGDQLKLKAQGFDSGKGLLIEKLCSDPKAGELDSIYSVEFGSDSPAISTLRLEIYDPITTSDAHIHIRGIKFVAKARL